MVRPVGMSFINAAQKSRYDQHLIAAQKSRYGCINLLHSFRGYGKHLFGTVYEEVRLSFIAVRSAFNRHRNRGCMTAVFAGHKFPDFEIKSVVEISSIFTVFLSYIFVEENNKSLSLTDWFSPCGFFQGLLAKNL